METAIAGSRRCVCPARRESMDKMCADMTAAVEVVWEAEVVGLDTRRRAGGSGASAHGARVGGRICIVVEMFQSATRFSVR